MKFKNLYVLLLVFILTCHSKTYCQIIDVFQGHIGTALFPSSEDPNFLTGKPENIYGAFSPAQTIGIGAIKFLTDKLQLVATFDVMNASKPHYTFISQKTSINLKYNFIAPDVYKFSPYLIGGGNFNLIYLSQGDFVRDYNPTGEYSGTSPQYVSINSINYRENEYNFFSPVVGGNIGAGLDVNVFEVISIFGEVNYNYILTKSSGLQNEFTSYNKSNLTYTNLTVGVRIYMY